jgi:hypothetical protein
MSTYAFDDAESGQLLIVIRKADADGDCGGVACDTIDGWLGTFESIQLVMHGNNQYHVALTLEAGYYEFDGVEGAGSDSPDDYGIQIKFDAGYDRGSNTGDAALVRGWQYAGAWPKGIVLTNLYFNNAKFADIGQNSNYANNGAFGVFQLGDSFDISYCLFSGGVVAIKNFGLGSPVPVIERNHFTNFYSSTSASPCQNQFGSIIDVVSQSGWIIRYNEFKDIIESGMEACSGGPDGSISLHGSTAFSDGQDGNGFKIYGNIFQGEATKEHIGWGGQTCPWKAHDWLIYNNTFMDTIGGIGRSTYFDGQCPALPVDGWEIRNNLFFDCTGVHTDIGNLNFVHSYNLYDLSTSVYASDPDTTTKVLSTQATRRMFIKSPSNLHLGIVSNAVDKGEDLGSPYDSDADGDTRGGDGLWDIGYDEYTGPKHQRSGGGSSGSSGS